MLPSTPGVFLPRLETTRLTANALAWNERVSRCCKVFTLFHRFSSTAFAIRICSLLTSRRAFFQSILPHVPLLSLSAPAEAVLCFPIYRGSPNDLATEHQSDVGAPFRRGGWKDLPRF